MKKLILLPGLLLLMSACAFAQYLPHQDFFFYNKAQFNPAFLAEEDRTNLVFAGKFYPGDESRFYPFDGYMAFEGYSEKINSRYGVSFENSSISFATGRKYRFMYAYDIGFFDRKLKLTPSFALTHNMIVANYDRLNLIGEDDFFLAGRKVMGNFDADFGIRLNYKQLNFGFSTQNVFESKMIFNSDGKYTRNHKVSEVFLSNRFRISDRLSIEPFSRVYELRNFIDDERPNPIIYLGSTVFLSERYSLGLQVETYNEAFSFFGGVRIADLVELNVVFADLKELKEVNHYALNAVLKIYLQ